MIASLGFEREASSQVYFFDTANHGLLNQGVILRVRQGYKNDLTVKVRFPDGDKKAVSAELHEHFECETDRTGSESSTSFSVGQKYTPNSIPAKGNDFLSALSARQRKLLQAAKVSIDWSSVKRIDINSKTWETTSQAPFRKLTLEHWEWPEGEILELSTRVAPNEPGFKSASLEQIVNAKGLSPSTDQETKTVSLLASLALETPHADAQSQAAPQETNPLATGANLVQVLERKSLVFPDLATNKGRLNSWDKFKLAANNSVSLSNVGAALIGGAYGQAIDSPSGYGQGGSGYGKRFGSGMARSASDNLFGTFMIASIMHEDPRFYVKTGLNFKQAVKYSAVRLVITRSDSGKPVVNYAGLLGPLAGEALANTYWPEENRGIGSTLTRYASDLGWRFGGNLLRQYWPQINRKLRLVPNSSQ